MHKSVQMLKLSEIKKKLIEVHFLKAPSSKHPAVTVSYTWKVVYCRGQGDHS